MFYEFQTVLRKPLDTKFRFLTGSGSRFTENGSETLLYIIV